MLQEAEQNCLKSYDYSQKLNDNVYINGSISCLSNILINLERYTESINFLSKMKINQNDSYYDTYLFNFGLSYEKLYKYEKAIDYYIKDVDYCKSVINKLKKGC